MIALFSGVGCQERGIENSGCFDLKVLYTSDINKDSIATYAAIHKGLTADMIEEYDNYPSRKQMCDALQSKNIGYDYAHNKPFEWQKLLKRKNKDIEKYWLADKMSNNLGDITKIQSLPYADLWTISFNCQDISVAGKLKGLKADSGTRSSLIWDNIRLLKDAVNKGNQPKYLLLENVKNLVGKKFIADFMDLLDVFSELGYNCYWKVLNAKNCGVPQNRERVFMIGIRKDIDSRRLTFPEPFDNGIRLKDVLDQTVSEEYYVNSEKANELVDRLKKEGSIESDSCARIQKLTEDECFVLMGLTKEDAAKSKNIGTAKSHLYAQAGNGIVTNCVQYIFEHLYKAQYDESYVTTDEKMVEKYGR